MKAFVTIISLALLTAASAIAQASDSPIKFKPEVPGFRELPIMQTYVVKQSDPPLAAKEKWPFTRPEILIACAPSSMNVMLVGNTYAALNGFTSGFADRYRIEDRSGRRSSYIRTRDNADLRRAGIVAKNTTDPQIGAWRDALNSKLNVVPMCK